MNNPREIKCPKCGAKAGFPCRSRGYGVRPHTERREAAGVRAIKLVLLPREDGGLRVYSTSHHGLILSGNSPQKVMADILPALNVMREYKRKRRQY